MKFKRETMLRRWEIPAANVRMDRLRQLADSNKVAKHALDALQTGTFTDGSGRSEPLGLVRNPIEQVALIAWLAAQCPTKLSIEVGFGMGITASIILAARLQVNDGFEHRIFDPYGLPGKAGVTTENFLKKECGKHFRRSRKRSQFGMAEVASGKDAQHAAFILIDGDHRTDSVFADFYMADALMPVGGYMLLDDARYAPVDTVVRFVMRNRRDYEVSHLEIPNTAVFRRIAKDQRAWNHFETFSVPTKNNWDHASLND